jgi:SAM-dependent methyltransferase
MISTNYTIIEGFKCYDPDLAYQNDGFPSDHFDRLAELEEDSFWFKARNLILIHLFKKYVGEGASKKVMEIGSGNGYVLKGLSQLNYTLIGTEIYLDGLKNIRKRLPNIELIQLNALQLPFQQEFDAIGSFDVLEHIEEDEQVMKNVYTALKNKGFFIITVPQHPFLWSYIDEYAKHKRRYSRKELKEKLIRNGFEVKYIGSFVFTLFPFVLLSRIVKKNKPIEQVTFKDVEAEFLIPKWMNTLFYYLLKLDYLFIRLGISLPFGSSLVAVAEKQ